MNSLTLEQGIRLQEIVIKHMQDMNKSSGLFGRPDAGIYAGNLVKEFNEYLKKSEEQ